MSFVLTIPKSPCNASVGWRKKLAVPVEARVAAILLPMCPLLPTPVMISLPPCEVVSRISDTIWLKLEFGRVWQSDEAELRREFASSFKTFAAICVKSSARLKGLFCVVCKAFSPYLFCFGKSFLGFLPTS